MATELNTATGVIILGGQENALSVARSLGRIGVSVCVIGAPAMLALRSRYCTLGFAAQEDETLEALFARVLMMDLHPDLRGRIIFPCCDEAIAFLAENDAALRERFILETASPQQREMFLDKLKTIALAQSAGIATPKVWKLGDGEIPAEETLRFPLMIKPVLSHAFTEKFGRKLFIIQSSYRELLEKLATVREAGLDVFLVEMIPGPDDALSSYYTYFDDEGEPLYHFTKRVIRRFPENSGAACFHETAILPETRQAGEALFRAADLRGMANVEFKRDPRDGALKIIEVNARFTAAQELARRAGAPLDIIAYAYLTGQTPPAFTTYREGLRYWYPVRDFLAFSALAREKRLSVFNWLGGVFGRPRINPWFAFDDLAPVWQALAAFIQKRLNFGAQ